MAEKHIPADLVEQQMAEVQRLKEAGLLYKPSEAHWDCVRPTYMENWPSDLHSLSIPSYFRKLTRDEALVLGSDIIELGEGFDVKHLSLEQKYELRSKVIADLQAQAGMLPGGAFVRLGSRSPKDAFYLGYKGIPDTNRAYTGLEAYDILRAGSERIYEDLQMALAQDYEPHIFLRQWIDLPEWSEFRCFQKNGELIGISQYYYRDTFEEVKKDADGFKWAIQQFHEWAFQQVTRENPQLTNVVFDVFVKVRHAETTNIKARYEVKLLEINPWYNLTDPCLFDWNKPNEFQGQLRYVTGPGSRKLTTAEV